MIILYPKAFLRSTSTPAVLFPTSTCFCIPSTVVISAVLVEYLIYQTGMGKGGLCCSKNEFNLL